VRPSPASGVEELVRGRRERTQIRFVLSEALVDDGVQLEVDLIDAAREMNGERLAVFPGFESFDEPCRTSEVEQRPRSGVQPVFGEAEVRRDAVTRLEECGRKWVRDLERAAANREYVDVRVGRLMMPSARRPEPPMTTSSSCAPNASSCSARAESTT
jgi:hypothetical protein